MTHLLFKQKCLVFFFLLLASYCLILIEDHGLCIVMNEHANQIVYLKDLQGSYGSDDSAQI